MLNGTFTAVGLISMSDAVVGGAFDCTTAQMNVSLADLNPGSGIAFNVLSPSTCGQSVCEWGVREQH